MAGADHPSALSGAFRMAFPEQLAFFRNKLRTAVPTVRWNDMVKEQHDTAIMVAGAIEADLITDMITEVYKAIESGKGIDAFRKEFPAIVAKYGWTGWTGENSPKGVAWRIRTIFRTNARTSYMAGRFAQLMEGKFAYWVYFHGGSREPRPEHLSWDGIALPPDHPFWITHFPPSDWGCTCYVSGTRTPAGVKRLGGDISKPLPKNWQRIDPRTGEQMGIGKGWGYTPGRSVAALVQTMAEKMRQWPALVGANFGGQIQSQIARAWDQWLDDVGKGQRPADALVGTLHHDDVVALIDRGQPPASAEIYFRASLIEGEKALRHALKGNAIAADDIANLPTLLSNPRAVLYDERSGKLLYVLDGEPRAPQFVIAIDYKRRGSSDKAKANIVISAYRQQMIALRNDLRAGTITLLRGGL